MESSVHDAIKITNGISEFKQFLDSLYSIYSLSAKNSTKLKNCAQDLDEEFRKIGKLFTIRWIASSYITVDAVLNSYVSLSKHLLDAAQDAKRSSTQRASYKGFHSLLTSVHFLKNLAIMHDVLKELSNLSVVLQERSLIIPRAYKMIELYIVRIASLKESAGEKVNEVRDSESTLQYKGIVLNQRNCRQINIDAFIDAVCDSMRMRLYTTVANNCDEPSAKKRKTEFEVFLIELIN